MSELPNEIYGWAAFIAAMPQDEAPRRALMPSSWPGLESWSFAPRDCASGHLTIFPLIEDDE